MTTDAKCREIIQAILRECNEDQEGDRIVIGFGQDWGGNSLTVHRVDLGHTHVGVPEATFEQFIDGLHGLLVHDRGLSFASPPDRSKQ